ncbi:phosphoribosylformylglycinamidine synthase subunit PurQ [Candidatus Bathyarchaeota archaeon]|nr:phosphoribosylformylglycinamidine synthase subunit PurQ [Candidatus Bathyarchaeota archaeon]
MNRSDINICIMRVGGTNCDRETKRAFNDLGVKADIVHINRIVRDKNLNEYDGLVLPGGFSYGDYVRAGAIWADRILDELKLHLEEFVENGKPILGICNGFQVLIEMGLLPGFKGISKKPEAALATNTPSAKYECRWVYLKHENSGRCVFTRKIPKGRRLFMPVAHAEGRLIFAREKEDEYLRKLYDNDQLVFRYCDENGDYANGRYPINPNGSFHDIAGICNPDGNVFGLMPHPERAYYSWQLPDWTRRKRVSRYWDGRLIFESMVEYLMKKF